MVRESGRMPLVNSEPVSSLISDGDMLPRAT